MRKDALLLGGPCHGETYNVDGRIGRISVQVVTTYPFWTLATYGEIEPGSGRFLYEPPMPRLDPVHDSVQK